MSNGAGAGRATRRVVVTGMGAVSPVGLDAESTWTALLAGISGGGPVTLWETPEEFACAVAAVAKGDAPPDRLE